jgi:hypothetical protein
MIYKGPLQDIYIDNTAFYFNWDDVIWGRDWSEGGMD